MTFVPNILLRRLYKKGSLRSIEEGIAFDLKNILGPGIITRLNFIKVNDHKFAPEKIVLKTNDKNIRMDRISEESPLFIAFQQTGTLILKGANCLINGKNKIVLELISREAGLIKVNVFDNISI